VFQVQKSKKNGKRRTELFYIEKKKGEKAMGIMGNIFSTVTVRCCNLSQSSDLKLAAEIILI
jgi:hypothetical protein